MNDTELVEREQNIMQSILSKIEKQSRLPEGFTVGDMMKVTHILNTYYGSLKVQAQPQPDVGEVDGSND
jgi:hypothetical protein